MKKKYSLELIWTNLNLSSASDTYTSVDKLNSWTKGNEQGQTQSSKNAVCTEREHIGAHCTCTSQSMMIMWMWRFLSDPPPKAVFGGFMTNSDLSGHLWVPYFHSQFLYSLLCNTAYRFLWPRRRFGVMSSQPDDPAGTSTSKEVTLCRLLVAEHCNIWQFRIKWRLQGN